MIYGILCGIIGLCNMYDELPNQVIKPPKTCKAKTNTQSNYESLSTSHKGLRSVDISQVSPTVRNNYSFRTNPVPNQQNTITLTNSAEKNGVRSVMYENSHPSTLKNCFPNLQYILDKFGTTTKPSSVNNTNNELGSLVVQNAYDYQKRKRKPAFKIDNIVQTPKGNYNHSQRVTKGSAFKSFLNKLKPQEYKLPKDRKRTGNLNRTVQVSQNRSKSKYTTTTLMHNHRVFSSDRIKEKKDRARPKTGKLRKIRPFSAIQY